MQLTTGTTHATTGGVKASANREYKDFSPERGGSASVGRWLKKRAPSPCLGIDASVVGFAT